MLKKRYSTPFKDDEDEQSDVTHNDRLDTSGSNYYRRQTSREEDFQRDQSRGPHECETNSDRGNSHNSGLERPPSPCSSEKGCNLKPKCPGILDSTGRETPGRAYVPSEGSCGSGNLSRPPTPYCAVSLDGKSSRSASPVKETLSKDDVGFGYVSFFLFSV